METSEALYPGGKSLAVDPSGDLVLVGGSDGVAGVYSLSQKKVVYALKAGGAVQDGIWTGDRAVTAASNGSVKVFEQGSEIASFSSHAGEVTSLALHPSGDILVSVGIDKSFVLYDLATLAPITQIYTDSGMFRCSCTMSRVES